MRVFYAIILGLILAVVFVFNYRKEKDLFSPLCFVCMMIFIRYVPNMLSKDFEHFSYLNDENIGKLFLVEVLALFSIVIGYKLGSMITIGHGRKALTYTDNTFSDSSDSNIKEWIIVILFTLGLIARLRIIMMSGGIRYIATNVATAYKSLSNGSGILSMLSVFSVVAVMMELSLALREYNNGNYNKFKRRRIVLIFMILIYSLTFLIFTSRSPIFELLLFVLFGINYLWRKIQIKDFFNPKVIIIIVVSLALIVILPIIRQGHEISESLDLNIISGVFDEFSYVGRDTYVYDHFNPSNYWHGGNYRALLTAFIPYRFYPLKPPIDDGVYLANIMYGHWVVPPVPRDSLTITYSIPFSTPSILYANFGSLGVFLGELLMGIVYAKVYKKLKTRKNVLWVIVSQLVLYQLELSTLSIVQTVIPLLVAFFAYKLATSVKISIKV